MPAGPGKALAPGRVHPATTPLLPGVALGYALSAQLRWFLHHGSRLRPAIPGFVALASVAVVVQTLA